MFGLKNEEEDELYETYTDIDELLDRWEEAIETNEEMVIFNQYKVRMFEGISNLLKHHREKVWYVMLGYFYQDHLNEINVDYIHAKIVDVPRSQYRGSELPMAFHLYNFIKHNFGEEEFENVIKMYDK